MLRRALFFPQRSRRNLCSASTAAAANWEYDYDVLIAGGGVVGSLLGCQLAESGALRVALVEGRPPAPVEAVMGNEVPDARVYSLTPASKRLLENVGAWDTVAARAEPFESMQVWDKRGLGVMQFHASDSGAAELGFVAENNVLQSVLFDRLRALESDGRLTLLCPSQVEGVSLSGAAAGQTAAATPAMEVRLIGAASKADVRVRLLVAADGGKSKVRELCGLETWGWDYGQRAVVATVKTEVPHTTAWQRFLPRGPLALLPLWDGYSSLVWSTTPRQAAELSEMPEAEFLERLNDALRSDPDLDLLSGPASLRRLPLIGPAVGGAAAAARAVAAMAGLSEGGPLLPPLVTELKSKRLGFPLSIRQAKCYVGTRVALVGDAAHTIHPMAGQGLNLGLADAASLAGSILSGHAAGADIGSATVLRPYDADRRAKNLAFLGGLDALHRLFAESGVFREDAAGKSGDTREAGGEGAGVVVGGMAATALARGAGMGVINSFGPLKARIAKTAMGMY